MNSNEQNEAQEKPRHIRYFASLKKLSSQSLENIDSDMSLIPCNNIKNNENQLPLDIINLKPSVNRFAPTSLKARESLLANRSKRIQSSNPYQSDSRDIKSKKFKSIRLGLNGKLDDAIESLADFKISF